MCYIPHWGFQPVGGGYLQQGGLVVKEDHPAAGSFPVQLHYVHHSESVLCMNHSMSSCSGGIARGHR